jgi:hypothetical protein
MLSYFFDFEIRYSGNHRSKIAKIRSFSVINMPPGLLQSIKSLIQTAKIKNTETTEQTNSKQQKMKYKEENLYVE